MFQSLAPLMEALNPSITLLPLLPVLGAPLRALVASFALECYLTRFTLWAAVEVGGTLVAASFFSTPTYALAIFYVELLAVFWCASAPPFLLLVVHGVRQPTHASPPFILAL